MTDHLPSAGPVGDLPDAWVEAASKAAYISMTHDPQPWSDDSLERAIPKALAAAVPLIRAHIADDLIGDLAPKADESYGALVERLVGAALVGPAAPPVEISAHAFESVKMLAWKATPYGETDDGDVASYIIPKGTLHRLIGAMQSCGHSVSLRAFPGAADD